MKCYTCGREVKPEYSVVFRWWDATRVHHPSCILVYEATWTVPPRLATQGELLPPEWVQDEARP